MIVLHLSLLLLLLLLLIQQLVLIVIFLSSTTTRNTLIHVFHHSSSSYSLQNSLLLFLITIIITIRRMMIGPYSDHQYRRKPPHQKTGKGNFTSTRCRLLMAVQSDVLKILSVSFAGLIISFVTILAVKSRLHGIQSGVTLFPFNVQALILLAPCH
jgi:hypothetical protein